jgi:hypothetical protein
MRRLIILVASACSVNACIPARGAQVTLRSRAAFDFGCPQDQLQLSELGNPDTVGVSGCAQRATYLYDARRDIWVMDAAPPHG